MHVEGSNAKHPHGFVNIPIVTRLPNVRAVNSGKSVGLNAILNEIRGSDKLRQRTKALRDLRKIDEARYKERKNKFPAVIFGGEFSRADNAHLKRHSGLMVLDFDKINSADVLGIRDKFFSDPHTALVFVSPSGCGVKWIVRVTATNANEHKECFLTAAAYAQKEFGIQSDESGKDVSRKCFLCHDAEVALREPERTFTSSKPIPVELETSFSVEKGSCDTGLQGDKGNRVTRVTG